VNCDARLPTLPIAEYVSRSVARARAWERMLVMRISICCGGVARELRSRLCAAATDERFAIVEAELLSRWALPPCTRCHLRGRRLARPEARVGDIAKRAGFNRRTLIGGRTWGKTRIRVAGDLERDAPRGVCLLTAWLWFGDWRGCG
jgi:hypothetical protein